MVANAVTRQLLVGPDRRSNTRLVIASHPHRTVVFLQILDSLSVLTLGPFFLEALFNSHFLSDLV